MRVIKFSLTATLHIFALITHQGGSVELANKLNDGVSLLPEFDIASFIWKNHAGQAPDADLH
jgi:hypothetical protein